ncbi:MAG: hypothetical protein Q7T85_10980 [Nitrosomonas sp.]|nr:hypothetical protein [Nitrosomonas sp.]
MLTNNSERHTAVRYSVLGRLLIKPSLYEGITLDFIGSDMTFVSKMIIRAQPA